MYVETQKHITKSVNAKTLQVTSEHIAYCVCVRISYVQYAAKWTWITIFLLQSEMCWNHLVLDTAGRVSTPQEVSSDHSEGSLMSQSVSLSAFEDVQAYFSLFL